MSEIMKLTLNTTCKCYRMTGTLKLLSYIYNKKLWHVFGHLKQFTPFMVYFTAPSVSDLKMVNGNMTGE
jgi:hypothetical protein